MKKSKFANLMMKLEEDRFKPCSMCGKVTKGYRTASSLTPITTHNGKTLIVTIHYTMDKGWHGYTGNNKIAGICKSCEKKILFKVAYWPGILKLIRNWFMRLFKKGLFN